MATVTVTAAAIRPLQGARTIRLKAGTTLTPGQPVYMTADDTLGLALGDSVGHAGCVGLVVSDSTGAVSFSSGTYVDVLTLGPMTGFLANLTAGVRVYIADDGTLATTVGTIKSIVGIGLNTTDLLVHPHHIAIT